MFCCADTSSDETKRNSVTPVCEGGLLQTKRNETSSVTPVCEGGLLQTKRNECDGGLVGGGGTACGAVAGLERDDSPGV